MGGGWMGKGGGLVLNITLPGWKWIPLWPCMEVISLWHCWGGMEAQVSLTVAFNSSEFFGLLFFIFLLTISHRFSMGALLNVQTPVQIWREFNLDPSSTWHFKRTRITQTSVRRAWYTHTHAGAWTCCSVYRLFCKTTHIATSNILDKP